MVIDVRPAKVLEFGYADREQPSGRSTLLVAALQREGFAFSSLLVDPNSRAKSLQFALNTLRAAPAQFVFLRFPYFPWMLRCAIFLKRKLKARLVVDAMVSAYQTIILDRELYSPYSRRARSCKQEDLLIGKEADLLVVDSHVHATNLAIRFDCSISKMVVVPVGSPIYELAGSPGASHRTPTTAQQLTVLYLGSFVPLHGIEVIIGAAQILMARSQNIHFKLIGEGQDSDRARQLAAGINTIQFIGGISRQQALAEVQQSDIVLGIFGSSIKAKLVLPFKVYDALACGKPVITARTPASEELLQHGVDSWLVQPEPGPLAEAIELLASNPDLRAKLGREASRSYQASFQSSIAIKPLIERLTQMASSQTP